MLLKRAKIIRKKITKRVAIMNNIYVIQSTLWQVDTKKTTHWRKNVSVGEKVVCLLSELLTLALNKEMVTNVNLFFR